MILSLETATSVCSVALHNEGRLIACAFNADEQTASSQLAILIQRVVNEAGIEMPDLNSVAVSAGPGSYTGLRIGVATAKGLCHGLGIPLISIGTLEILIQSVLPDIEEGALLCPMLDARRMEVYCMVSDADGNLVEPVQAMVVDEGSFNRHLKINRMFFFGSGAEKCAGVIKHPNATFLKGVQPDAKNMGVRAFRKFQDNAFEEIDVFEPFYLKDFVAKKPKSET